MLYRGRNAGNIVDPDIAQPGGARSTRSHFFGQGQNAAYLPAAARKGAIILVIKTRLLEFPAQQPAIEILGSIGIACHQFVPDEISMFVCHHSNPFTLNLFLQRHHRHKTAKDHPLAIMAERYALLAIEQDDRHYISPENFPLANHAAVELVSNLEPYYLRKVRVLNGVHTAMVAKYLGSSLDTVQRILADDAGQRWARDLLYGEILPTLIGRVEGAVQFVDDTLDRFTNPFLSHRLSDIRLNHEQKVPVRLVPTADDYEHRFGCRPPLLQAAIDTVLQ